MEGLHGYLRGRVLQHDGRGWATTVAAHQIGRSPRGGPRWTTILVVLCDPHGPLACATTQHRQTLLQHHPLHSRPGAGRLYITAHQAPPSSRLPLNATFTLRLITDLLFHIPLLSPYDVVLPLSFFFFSTSTFICCIIDLFHDVLRGHSSDDDEQRGEPECDKVNNWRVLSIIGEE